MIKFSLKRVAFTTLPLLMVGSANPIAHAQTPSRPKAIGDAHVVAAQLSPTSVGIYSNSVGLACDDDEAMFTKSGRFLLTWRPEKTQYDLMRYTNKLTVFDTSCIEKSDFASKCAITIESLNGITPISYSDSRKLLFILDKNDTLFQINLDNRKLTIIEQMKLSNLNRFSIISFTESNSLDLKTEISRITSILVSKIENEDNLVIGSYIDKYNYFQIFENLFDHSLILANKNKNIKIPYTKNSFNRYIINKLYDDDFIISTPGQLFSLNDGIKHVDSFFRISQSHGQNLKSIRDLRTWNPYGRSARNGGVVFETKRAAPKAQLFQILANRSIKQIVYEIGTKRKMFNCGAGDRHLIRYQNIGSSKWKIDALFDNTGIESKEITLFVGGGPEDGFYYPHINKNYYRLFEKRSSEIISINYSGTIFGGSFMMDRLKHDMIKSVEIDSDIVSEFLIKKYPNKTINIVGFSFGSFVSAKLHDNLSRKNLQSRLILVTPLIRRRNGGFESSSETQARYQRTFEQKYFGPWVGEDNSRQWQPFWLRTLKNASRGPVFFSFAARDPISKSDDVSDLISTGDTIVTVPGTHGFASVSDEIWTQANNWLDSK